MDKYIFRGQEITGAHAVVLLRAIKLVMVEAPNPSFEDINVLLDIVEDFGQKFQQSLRDHQDELQEISVEWSVVDADGLDDLHFTEEEVREIFYGEDE